MFKIFSSAGVAVLASLVAITLSGATGSRALAQDLASGASMAANVAAMQPATIQPAIVTAPAVTPLSPAPQASPDATATQSAPDAQPSDAPALTLADLVSRQAVDGEITPELRCLATAIYFEAGHETEAGQLAVGRVIVARTKSGRFPENYCGVVKQHAQFSFVHGGELPAVNEDSRAWHNSLAVARISDAGSWKSQAEGALFFHAAHNHARWKMERVAQVDNNVFYH